MNTQVSKLQPGLVWHMYRALVGIGILCAFVIVSVFLYTEPYIQANKKAALEAAIFTVVKNAETRRTLYWIDETLTETRPDNEDKVERIYAAYGNNGKLAGFAIAANGMGYQDNIYILYGYDPVQATIVGFTVLSSRETPGLGSRIATDSGFLRNFDHLDVALDEDKTALANPISLAKSGQSAKPWQIDSITGATVSSKAVARILHDSASRWLTRIALQYDNITIGK